MLPHTSACQPRENGQPATSHPIPLGEHITLQVADKWLPPSGGKLASPKQASYSQHNSAVTAHSLSAPVSQTDAHMGSRIPRTATTKRKPQTSALTHAPRSIKASAGWLWQDHTALEVIAAAYTGERGRAARSVYLALSQIASSQRTADKAHTSCEYLGSLAMLSERATRRYLHEFQALGLIAVIAGVHQANTYILLACGRQSILADSDTLLNEDGGITIAPAAKRGSNYPHRAGASDRPDRRTTKSKAATGDTPAPEQVMASSTILVSRTDSSGSQISRTKDSKNQETTNNSAAGDFSLASNFHNDIATNSPMLRIASREQTPETAESTSAISALVGIGVRGSTAKEIAALYSPEDIRGWVRYATTAGGLKSRAGFVLSMLRAGEAPPQALSSYRQPRFNPSAVFDDASYVNTTSYAPPNGTEGLIEPLPTASETKIEATAAAIEDATSYSPLSTTHLQFWHAAHAELARQITGPAWGLWLKHVQLVHVEAENWILTRPPIGVAEGYECRYTADIAQILTEVSGGEVRLCWMSADTSKAIRL